MTEGAAVYGLILERVRRQEEEGDGQCSPIEDDDEDDIQNVVDELLTREIIEVPLKNIFVDVTIKGCLAEVTSYLTYENKEEEPFDAAFLFPLDQDSAVFSFQAEIDNRVIVGECMTKEEAEATYQAAKDAMKTAFVLREQCDDVFSIRIGNLPPRQEVKITFSYAVQLPINVDGSVEFVLPTVLNPRYCPSGADPTSVLPGSSHTHYVRSRPDVLDLHATVIAGETTIKVICSNSDKLEVIYGIEQKTATAKLAETFNFDHDIKLHVLYENPRQPNVVYEPGDPEGSGFLKQDVIMMNFFPDLEWAESDFSPGEYIFVIDRSASMRGERTKAANAAMMLFLKSLPVGCYFNIVSFGSTYTLLFNDGSARYGEESVKAASQLIEKSEELGGTKILEPLRAVYAKDPLPDHPRQVFLLTDGEISNTNDVIDLVRKNRSDTRVFTIGLGEGASSALIKGAAKAGLGSHEFVYNVHNLQEKVMSLLKDSQFRFTGEVNLSWDLPGGGGVVEVPTEMPLLFPGSKLVMYAIMKEPLEEGQTKGNVELSVKLGDTEKTCKLEFTKPTNQGSSTSVHRLAAKTKIEEMELEWKCRRGNDEIKKAILVLSLASNVVSIFTSFVAVDQESQVKCLDPIVGRNVVNLWHDMHTHRNLKCYGLDDGGHPRSKKFKAGGAGAGMLVIACCSCCLGIWYLVKKCREGCCKRRRPSEDSDQSKSQLVTSQPKSITDLQSTGTSVDKTDNLMSMVKEQKFDGHWVEDEEVLALLGQGKDDIIATSPVKDNMDVWVTCLVLAWLETKHSERKAEWEMIHKKAFSWLEGQGNNLDGMAVSEMIERAQHSI